MRIGVVFPQYEIGADPSAIRDFAQAVESIGYNHLVTYEHVLGAGTQYYPDLKRPYGDTHRAYTEKDLFHEPFVLFGYLSAVTQRIELVTGVLILPQRQTALVAKQAAQVDVLSGGRLRLGVGLGWNKLEYEALGEDFHNKASRIEEQIEVLRALWTQPAIDFDARWHRIPGAGINPLPLQRPVPIWMGGGADTVKDVVIERIARLSDGWLSQMDPNQQARQAVTKLRLFARAANRDPGEIGIEPRLNLREVDSRARRSYVADWGELGASHISVSTLGMGHTSPQGHIEAIERAWVEIGLEDFQAGSGTG